MGVGVHRLEDKTIEEWTSVSIISLFLMSKLEENLGSPQGLRLHSQNFLGGASRAALGNGKERS